MFNLYENKFTPTPIVVDLGNECKMIETKRTLGDQISWDKTYMKVNSLIFFSIGAQAWHAPHFPNAKPTWK